MSDSLVSRELRRMGVAQTVVAAVAEGVLEVAGGVRQCVLLRPGSGDNASGTVSEGGCETGKDTTGKLCGGSKMLRRY